MYLFGAGGHAKVIIDIMELNGFVLKGIFDDDISKKSLLGYPVIGSFSKEIIEDDKLLLAIGDNVRRKWIAEQIIADYFKVIHPNSIVSKYSTIGKGSVVMVNAIINADSAIHEHCIINTAALIEHDCRIGDFVHIAPHATLCGGVRVGDGALIGAGAIIKPNITIGKNAVVGAGAVITKDVPDNAVMAGVPGRLMK